MHGGHVYVWWTCVCMVDVCMYGGHVYVWWTCICMVDMYMYGGKSKESHLQDTPCNASVFIHLYILIPTTVLGYNYNVYSCITMLDI